MVKKSSDGTPKWHQKLFWQCVGVFILTAILLVAAWLLWGELFNLKGENVGRATSALTTVGGLGGAVFLTVKYRERSSAERTETDERLVSAVSQLGSSWPQVRIAGVYALEVLAYGDYKQRVVNILCGYLRTHRENDEAVESSILQVVSNHLRKRPSSKSNRATTQGVTEDQLWSSCLIDLHSVTLTEHFDFGGATLNVVDFGDATIDYVLFDGATFKAAYFGGATFKGASFSNANFESVDFSRSTFMAADFSGAAFKSVGFDGASFGTAIFKDAKFDPVGCADIVADLEGLPEGASWWDFENNQPADTSSL